MINIKMINIKEVNIGDIIVCETDFYGIKNKKQIIYIMSKFTPMHCLHDRFIFKNITINKITDTGDPTVFKNSSVWIYKLIKSK